ncbi:MAG: hypothetical protein WC436_03900 [Candidatus Babeliales bacterium]
MNFMKNFCKFFLLLFLMLDCNKTICAIGNEIEDDIHSNFSTETFNSDNDFANRLDESESTSSEENFYLDPIESDTDSESSFASDSSEGFEDLVRDFVESIKNLSSLEAIKKFSNIIKDLDNVEIFSILYENLEEKLNKNSIKYQINLILLNFIKEKFIENYIEKRYKLTAKLLKEIDNNTSITPEERELQKKITFALNSFEKDLISLNLDS